MCIRSRSLKALICDLHPELRLGGWRRALTLWFLPEFMENDQCFA
jgi:hypothetical protein